MRLAFAVELRVLPQQPLQMHVDIALVSDQADRAVGQALRRAHVLDRIAQRQFEQRDQAGEFAAGSALSASGLLSRRLDLVEIGRAARHRAEWVLLVFAKRRHPELVDRIGQQQHLDAAGAEAFELRDFCERSSLSPVMV